MDFYMSDIFNQHQSLLFIIPKHCSASLNLSLWLGLQNCSGVNVPLHHFLTSCGKELYSSTVRKC